MLREKGGDGDRYLVKMRRLRRPGKRVVAGAEECGKGRQGAAEVEHFTPHFPACGWLAKHISGTVRTAPDLMAWT